MTVHGWGIAESGLRPTHRAWLATVAVCVGVAAATGHGVAWADTGQSQSSSTSGTSSTDAGSESHTGPRHRDDDHRADPGTRPPRTSNTSAGHSDSPASQHDSPATGSDATVGSGASGPPSDTGATTETSSASEPDSGAADQDPSPTTPRRAPRAAKPTTTSTPAVGRGAHQTVVASDAAPAGGSTTPARSEASSHSLTSAAEEATAPKMTSPMAEVAAVATTTAATATTPSPPEPPSPLAELVALPGRIVNTILQALDLTVSANGPKSPFDFSPIDELLFAAFRRVENALGLDRTPAVPPVVATETYTGPTTAVTPTVTQFLDASAAEYVLGGTPGGLQPFTVGGLPLASTNILSGESAQVWVTPQQQLIIAYQGTTGGTNLLFNPLIAISQIITDAQVILTGSTPQAFTDSLTFAQQVQAAAALQGYAPGDVFVTGHSLGGWEAEYVAQQTGLGGIGFESPGINTIVPGNGVDSGFVNVETYGDPAAYSATDLPGLQPFLPAYVPGGGSKPHYGSIVMIGDPTATNPLINAAALFGPNLFGDIVFAVDLLGNFFEHHLPGMQAYNLGISPDPGVVPWLGSTMGPVDAGWGDLTISQLEQAASLAGQLITP
ncbi:MAG: hypothetical protein QOJ95_3172 [Mycobacterium sp.]|nr:hypothetical protein [Mycobacterium sp.]